MKEIIIKFSTIKKLLNLAYTVVFFIVALWCFNYEYHDGMRLSKELSTVMQYLLLIMAVVFILTTVFLTIKFTCNSSVCTINKNGLSFYYYRLYQNHKSFVRWDNVENISLITTKAGLSKISYVCINVIDLKKFKNSNHSHQKYIEKSIEQYNHPIAFQIHDLNRSQNEVYNIIIEYWNEWKKNNKNTIDSPN